MHLWRLRVAELQGGIAILVLSRREGQRILIGDDIVLEVVEIRGDKIRLGISAPKDVPVHREEVWLAIRRDGENRDREASVPS